MKRKVLVIICLVVACIVGIVIGIALCTGNVKTSENMSKEEAESLFYNYYYNVMGQDMFDSLDKGYHEIQDEYKMYVAAVATDASSVDCAAVAQADKHFKASTDDFDDSIIYEYEADENSVSSGYTILCEEDDAYAFDDLNERYKTMFNGEATKKSFSSLRSYFIYVPGVNVFINGFANIGCTGCFDPIISIEKVETKKNKLYITIYYAAVEFNFDTNKIEISNDKSISYNSEEDAQKVPDSAVEDMLKNHTDKMNEIKLTFDIVKDEYHLLGYEVIR